MGERVGDAYAYRNATPAEAHDRSRRAATVQPRTGAWRSEFELIEQSILPVLAGFALGYAAAWLIRSRQ